MNKDHGTAAISDTVFSQVAGILHEVRGREIEDFVHDAKLFNELSFESIDLLELAFVLEEEFGFAPGFPTDEFGVMMLDHMSPDRGQLLTETERELLASHFEEHFLSPFPMDLLGRFATEPSESLRQPTLDLFTVGFIANYVMQRLALMSVDA